VLPDVTTHSKAENMVADDVLRDKVGIDPRRLSPVLDLVALGLVNMAWRNTVVENWHAEGRIHDGDMLRVNAYSSWRLRQLLARWCDEVGLGADDPPSALDRLRFANFMWLGGRIHRWLVNPARCLPDGRTVRDLAGQGLLQLDDDADQAVTGWVGLAQDRGISFAVRWVAAHGGLACRGWWGHPMWPDAVTRFLGALDNPKDAHWGDNGELWDRLRPQPAMVRDRPALARALRDRPWRLDADSALWVVSAGIKYARPRNRAVRPV
jgi:hypothetical protein